MASKNKLQKLREMELTINKVENMISKSKQEMKSLEVEWLHLRGLVTENPNDKSKQTETTKPKNKEIKLDDVKEINLDADNEINFDDVNKINSTQFNPDSLRTSNAIFIKGKFYEIESSDEDY